MNQPEAEPYFEARDGRFVPSHVARGPWDPKSLHGRVIAGLLGRTLEQRYGEETWQFARLTVELFRVAPIAPLKVDAELIREGNRIRVADGIVTAEGVEVARAHGVMLRRADQPEGDVWSPPGWQVPSPEETPVAPEDPTFRPSWEIRPIAAGGAASTGPKRVWLRETRALVSGEALSPFVRCALASDYTNPFANSGSAGLRFVNADVTLYLHRLPAGEWLGLEVASHQSEAGIAVGESTLYDGRGAIGRSSVCSVANSRRP